LTTHGKTTRRSFSLALLIPAEPQVAVEVPRASRKKEMSMAPILIVVPKKTT